MNEATKTCAKCRLELPIIEFKYDRRTRDHLTYRCHTCRAQINRPKSAERIWPIQPFLKATRIPTISIFTQRMRCNGTVASKAFKEGLTDSQADIFACRAGLHPLEIWPNWCDERTIQ